MTLPSPVQSASLFALTLLALVLSPSDARARQPGGSPHWPSFRGERARGVSFGAPTPTEWNLATGANVRWQRPIPGLAYSSPITWGDRIFLTTAVRLQGDSFVKVGLYGSPNSQPDEGPHRFQVLCLDRFSGELIWSRTAVECEPDTRRHPKGSFAASTPATDGRYLAAFFGSEGLFVYDLDGQLIWQRDFGVLDAGWYVAPDAQFGYAASPVIHDGLLFIQADVQQDPFLCALDLATGEEAWRVERDEVPTWSSPTIDAEHGREQVLVNGYHHIGSYDLRSGAELWKMAGGGDVPVPTPIVAFDSVFITNGHGRWNPIYRIDIQAEGLIENGFDVAGEEHVLWSQKRQGTYMQTPLVHGDHLFASNDSGVVSCIDARSGELLERRRLGSGGDGFTASPVASGGHLYFTSEYGEIHVITADAEMNDVAVNSMNEVCMATPAISDGTLFIRTSDRLVALAEGASSAPISAIARAEPEAEPAAEEDPIRWLPLDDLPTAEQLITDCIRARGGEERLSAVDSATVEGEWEIVGIGLKGKVSIRYRKPGLVLIRSEMPGMADSLQGYDGEVAWMLNPAAGDMPLTGPLAEEVKRQARLFPELTWAEEYDEMETLGLCRYEDLVCFAVEMRSGTDRKDRVFFDADGGLLHARQSRVFSVAGPMNVIEVHLDYREFEGVQIPTRVENRFPEQSMQMTSRVESVSFDEISLELFRLPDEIRAQLEEEEGGESGRAGDTDR